MDPLEVLMLKFCGLSNTSHWYCKDLPAAPRLLNASKVNSSQTPTLVGPMIFATGLTDVAGGCSTIWKGATSPVTQPSSTSCALHRKATTLPFRFNRSPERIVGSVPKKTSNCFGRRVQVLSSPNLTAVSAAKYSKQSVELSDDTRATGYR